MQQTEKSSTGGVPQGQGQGKPPAVVVQKGRGGGSRGGGGGRGAAPPKISIAKPDNNIQSTSSSSTKNNNNDNNARNAGNTAKGKISAPAGAKNVSSTGPPQKNKKYLRLVVRKLPIKDFGEVEFLACLDVLCSNSEANLQRDAFVLEHFVQGKSR
jgi:hypothetical protein